MERALGVHFVVRKLKQLTVALQKEIYANSHRRKSINPAINNLETNMWKIAKATTP